MADASSEEKEEALLSWLSQQNADELEAVFPVIDLSIPTNLQGKRASLFKTLMKHLHDLSIIPDSDGGYSTILSLYDHMNSLTEKLNNDVKPQVNIEEKSLLHSNMFDGEGNVKATIDVMKLKDLKISGIIGGTGDKEKLSYSSLSYQIASAKKAGYSESRICAAVVKAIAPSNNLKMYLECKPDLDLRILIEILRSHFNERDSASVFTELGNAVQKSNENSHDFVVRLLCLRQKVADLGREEGCLYQENMLKKKMFQAMFTGMLNANIRVELRERCKNNFSISDTDLLKFVSEVIAVESERSEKFGSKKSFANSVNLLETVSKDKNISDKSKKDNPFTQIEEFKSNHKTEQRAQQKQIAEIETQIVEIKGLLHQNHKSYPENHNIKPYPHSTENRDDNYPGRYIPPHRRFSSMNKNSRGKCDKCVSDNLPRCNHCFY